VAQYIEKSTLLAEIERLHKAHSGRYGCDEVGLNLEYLEDFIDTLEVKEVNLEEESRKWEDKVYLECGYQDSYGTPHAPFHEIGNAFIAGAKLILKVQKGK
jgi:hypothetical protein